MSVAEVRLRHLKRLLSQYVPTITKTARILDWARERPGTELAAETLVACCPRIAWAGCITVTIGRRPSLSDGLSAHPYSTCIQICAAFRGKRHRSPVSRPDGTCPLSEAALAKGRLKVHAWACKNPTTFGGRHFGEVHHPETHSSCIYIKCSGCIRLICMALETGAGLCMAVSKTVSSFSLLTDATLGFSFSLNRPISSPNTSLVSRCPVFPNFAGFVPIHSSSQTCYPSSRINLLIHCDCTVECVLIRVDHRHP